MTVLWSLLIAIAMQAAAPSPVTIIAKDMMSQIESPRLAVAQTAADWTKLWREHTGESTPPPVDLNARTVVAVFLGTRSSAGYAVEITGTRQVNGALVVRYEERRPGRDEISAQVITSPAVVASIPKFTGEIKFEKVDK